MPEQIRQQERPELGFTSVGQYLDANRGVLQAGYDKARQEAQDLGSSFGPLFPGGQAPSAPGATPGSQPSGQGGNLDYYLDQGSKARELSRSFQNEYALAGSGRYGEGLTGRGPGNFSSALQWAAYGPQYQGLSKYLDQFSPTAVRGMYQPQQQEKPEPRPPREEIDNEHIRRAREDENRQERGRGGGSSVNWGV